MKNIIKSRHQPRSSLNSGKGVVPAPPNFPVKQNGLENQRINQQAFTGHIIEHEYLLEKK